MNRGLIQKILNAYRNNKLSQYRQGNKKSYLHKSMVWFFVALFLCGSICCENVCSRVEAETTEETEINTQDIDNEAAMDATDTTNSTVNTDTSGVTVNKIIDIWLLLFLPWWESA